MSKTACGHESYPGDELHCTNRQCGNQAAVIHMKEIRDLEAKLDAAMLECATTEHLYEAVIADRDECCRAAVAAEARAEELAKQLLNVQIALDAPTLLQIAQPKRAEILTALWTEIDVAALAAGGKTNG